MELKRKRTLPLSLPFSRGFFFLFALIWSYPVMSQVAHTVTRYTAQDGLPQNSIRDMAFDPDGFLWIATEGGLTRFDGRNFRVYGKMDHPYLDQGRFSQLEQFEHGELYVLGPNSSVFSITNQQVENIQPPRGRSWGIPFHQGRVPYLDYWWADSLYRAERDLLNGRWFQSFTIIPLPEERCWLLGERIILHDYGADTSFIIEPDSLQVVAYGSIDNCPILLTASGDCYKLQTSPPYFQRQRLTGPQGDGIKPFGKDSHTSLSFPDPFFYVIQGESLFKVVSGQQLNELRVQPVLSNLPLSSSITTVVERPKQGLVLVGTNAHGLFLFRKNVVETFGQTQEDEKWVIYYAQALLNDTTLVTSYGNQFSILDFSRSGLFPFSFHSYKIRNASNGELYFIRHNNLFKYKSQTQSSVWLNKNDPKAIQWMYSAGGKDFIFGRGKMGELVNDRIHYYAIDLDKKGTPQCVEIGPEGKIWVGTQLGLFVIDTLKKEVEEIKALRKREVRTLANIQGAVFIGTYGHGWYIWNEGRLVKMPIEDHQGLNHVHSFFTDEHGFVYLTTNRGLFKVGLEAIWQYLDQRSSSLYYFSFLEESGIDNPEFNGGAFPNYLQLRDGRVSLPTMNGMLVFDPVKNRSSFPKSPIIIEKIRTEEVQWDYPSSERPIEIPAGQAEIQIEFATAWWDHAYNLQMDYRLIGLHQQDLPLGKDEHRIVLGQLKPGRYMLRIRKRVGFGPDDFIQKELPLRVLKPWHLQNWAWTLYGFGLVALVWGTARGYADRIRRRNKLLQQEVAARTQELRQANVQLSDNLDKLGESERELRQSVQAKNRLISIISHDILTPLRFIKMVSELAVSKDQIKPEEERNALKQINKASENLHRYTEEILQWVKYQQGDIQVELKDSSIRPLVQDLIEAFSEVATSYGNTLINDVPPGFSLKTDPKLLRIVLHNLLSNAVKYTGNGTIRLVAFYQNHKAVLTVEDSGRGMTYQEIKVVRKKDSIPDKNKENSHSIGLVIVGEMMDLLGGKWDIMPLEKGLKVQLEFIVGGSLPEV